MMLRLLAVVAVVCGMAQAQQPIGTVGVQDATIAGALVVTNGRAVLVGKHVGDGKGSYGGDCAEPGRHGACVCDQRVACDCRKECGGARLPLMLALDRGAVEVQMTATTSDVVMTPDLRFTMASEGPLDMRLRVTSNGDTCVENRGASAPVLQVADPFGGATYELRAGQHVLFEHGSLKEVVDNESSPCGCPPMPVVSVADAWYEFIAPAAVGSAVAAKSAAEQHPFPAAVSAGLAPTAAVPQAPPGVTHTQVATSLTRCRGGGWRSGLTATAGGRTRRQQGNCCNSPGSRNGKGHSTRCERSSSGSGRGNCSASSTPDGTPGKRSGAFDRAVLQAAVRAALR